MQIIRERARNLGNNLRACVQTPVPSVESVATIEPDYRDEMQNTINKPIFVVGSPRSGTSILTWCLGQHPNLFPVPESNWMGDFAVTLAIGYQVGAARGIFSMLSAMGISRDEFFSHIGTSINSLVLKHRSDLDRKRLMIAVQRL